jgi:hypothetical protein
VGPTGSTIRHFGRSASQLVCWSSGYSSMSVVFAPFWHARGTPPGCKLLARPCSLLYRPTGTSKNTVKGRLTLILRL